MNVKIQGIIGIFLVTACSQQSDKGYLGKWRRQHIEHQMAMSGADRRDTITDTLTIERNGSGYLLRSARTYQPGDDAATSYPANTTAAIMKDDQLQVAGGLAAYAIDQNSGHLIAPDGQGEFVKIQ